MATETLVVMSKVKAHLAAKDLRTSAEVAEALSEIVERILDVAAEVVKAEEVATVKAKHVKAALVEISRAALGA